MRIFFLLVFFFIANFTLQAQQKSVSFIYFSKLDSIIHIQDDTLRIINFWATWCKPCIEELPYFEQVSEEYAGKKVKVILISLDFESKMNSLLIPFVEKHNIKSQVFMLDQSNANIWIDKISPDWSGAIPASLFIRNDRSIKFFHEGSFTYAILKEKTDQFLTP